MTQLCEFCGGDDKDLTAIHLTINGRTVTVYFHNTSKKKCLEQWLNDQRTFYAAAQN